VLLGKEAQTRLEHIGQKRKPVVKEWVYTQEKKQEALIADSLVLEVVLLIEHTEAPLNSLAFEHREIHYHHLLFEVQDGCI
jgi:hypothetical protein